MRTKRKRKKLLKPKGSCRYAQCRQPVVPDGNRCEKHLYTPQNFEKRKDSATIITKEGDYEIMTTTSLGKATIVIIAAIVIGGIGGLFVSQQKQIDKLTRSQAPKMVIITATPAIASVSAKPTIMERTSSLVVTKTPTKGVLK